MAQHEAVTVSTAGDRPVVAISGHVRGDAAQELAAALQELDPDVIPGVTVDLRGALSLDPLAVHALLRAWDRWKQKPGSVRLIVTPGPVHRYLDVLGLDRALDLVGPGEEDETAPPPLQPEAWQKPREGALQHYHRLLETAQRRDPAVFGREAQEATPICVAVGAAPGGTAFGDWCEQCPLRQAYGGCRPIVAQMARAAEQGNWEAAQMLVLALIAEVVGMPAAAADAAERAGGRGVR